MISFNMIKRNLVDHRRLLEFGGLVAECTSCLLDHCYLLPIVAIIFQTLGSKWISSLHKVLFHDLSVAEKEDLNLSTGYIFCASHA